MFRKLSDGRAPTFVVAAGAAIVILAMTAHLLFDAVRHAAPWTNNDTAFFVYIGEQMHEGARLYIDWQDNDPPSVFLLTLTAVRIGHLIHLPAIVAYDLLTLVVAVMGLVVLVRSLVDLNRSRLVVTLASAAYLFFLMVPGQNVRDFGQREHLFALLLIPELFASASPKPLRWRPLWCAALAFIAMMKPQFAAIVAVLELTAPRTVRWRLRDLAGFAAGGVAPFALLWRHSPASLKALFADTLEVHLSGAYLLLNRSPTLLLARGPFLVLAAALTALAAMTLVAREDKGVRGLSGRGAVALLCCALAVIHQQKYAPYHFTPIFGLAIVLGSWAVGEWLASRRQAVLAACAATVLTIFGAVLFHTDVSANADPMAVRLGRVVGGNAQLLVVSVYLHGLCTPYTDAPRCIGPQAYTVRLPQMAWAPDGTERLRDWASTVAEQVHHHRPELVALSTSDLAMPDGVTPAKLLLEQFPSVPADEYVPLSPTAMIDVQARGWTILRRRDIPERMAVADETSKR